MLTFILNSHYQSSHCDYTFLMYKQTVSDRPRVKGRATILQQLAPGQPDPKRILKHKVYTFTFFSDGETDAFCSAYELKNTSSGFSCHKEVIRASYSTVSPCTLYQGILILQLLCKGACCTISSRAHVLNLSVSKKNSFPLLPLFPDQGSNIHRLVDCNI